MKYEYILEWHKFSSLEDDYSVYTNQKTALKMKAMYNRMGYTTYLHRRPLNIESGLEEIGG